MMITCAVPLSAVTSAQGCHSRGPDTHYQLHRGRRGRVTAGALNMEVRANHSDKAVLSGLDVSVVVVSLYAAGDTEGEMVVKSYSTQPRL